MDYNNLQSGSEFAYPSVDVGSLNLLPHENA